MVSFNDEDVASMVFAIGHVQGMLDAAKQYTTSYDEIETLGMCKTELAGIADDLTSAFSKEV